MKRFCLVNYNDYSCHPHFFYCADVESMYQFAFDNELIDFNYEGVIKEEKTIDDIVDIFNKIRDDPNSSFRTSIYEVPIEGCPLVPAQNIRRHNPKKCVVLGYEELEPTTQKELDITVQYVRNMEMKKSAFDRLKLLRSIEERFKVGSS